MTRQIFAYDPVLGYRFVPGLKTRVRHEGGGYNVYCNQAGFRCEHEVTPAPAPGVFRVLLFGDSFTAGDGVSNRFRFGDVLERRLQGVEILNFGLPGSGTDQQYLAFQELARGLEYHLLLICPYVENIERIVATHRKTLSSSDGKVVERAKPYFTLEGERLVLHHSPCPRETRPAEDDDWRTHEDPLRRRMRQLYHRFPAFNRAMKRVRNIRFPAAYEDPKSVGWRLMRRILTDWVAASKTEVVLCYFPLFAHTTKLLPPENVRARWLELGRNDKLTLVDLLPSYWRMSKEEQKALVFPGDEHPTRRGHEIIADHLEPVVRAAYDRWRRS